MSIGSNKTDPDRLPAHVAHDARRGQLRVLMAITPSLDSCPFGRGVRSQHLDLLAITVTENGARADCT